MVRLVRHGLICGVVVVVLGGCAMERDIVPIADSKQRIAEDRLRQQASDDVMGVDAARVGRDVDVERTTQALAPSLQRPSPPPFESNVGNPLIPDVGLHGGRTLALRDAVALIGHTIGYGVRFLPESDPDYPVGGFQNHQPAQQVLDHVAYESNHYITVFPQSRLILVGSEQRDRDPDGVPIRSELRHRAAFLADPDVVSSGDGAVVIQHERPETAPDEPTTLERVLRNEPPLGAVDAPVHEFRHTDVPGGEAEANPDTPSPAEAGNGADSSHSGAPRVELPGDVDPDEVREGVEIMPGHAHD